MSASRFEYEPLPPGCIRLLRILRCTDVWAECEMGHVKLDGGIPWSALSYVWGNAGHDRLITLNRKEFWIRPNLLHALTAIHYNGRQDLGSSSSMSSGTLHAYVWIDAICINQNDDQEKAEQVGLMRQIYSQARAVLVWFGKPTRELDAVCKIFQWINYGNLLEKAVSQVDRTSVVSGVIDSHDHQPDCPSWPEELRLYSFRLHRIARILRSLYHVTCEQLMALRMLVDGLGRREDGGVELTKGSIEAFVAQEDLSIHLFPPHHWFWRDFVHLFHNAWYRRVWTMQELVLSKNAVALCPKGVFPYDALEAYLRVLVPTLRSKAILDIAGRIGRGLSFDSIAAVTNAATVGLQVRCPLLFLLRQVARRNATVKSDYIYALLGIADLEKVSNIRIGYQQQPSAVFKTALKVALMDPDDAEELPLFWEFFEITLKATPNLPSWCPDLSNAHNVASLFDAVSHRKIGDAPSDTGTIMANARRGNGSGRDMTEGTIYWQVRAYVTLMYSSH